jgi:hypothetical protein
MKGGVVHIDIGKLNRSKDVDDYGDKWRGNDASTPKCLKCFIFSPVLNLARKNCIKLKLPAFISGYVQIF